MDDRRTKQRLNVSLNATWDSSTEAHSAQITNLSDGGCYLDSVGEVRRGEIVGFRVLLPDDDWLYLEGEVQFSPLSSCCLHLNSAEKLSTTSLTYFPNRRSPEIIGHSAAFQTP